MRQLHRDDSDNFEGRRIDDNHLSSDDKVSKAAILRDDRNDRRGDAINPHIPRYRYSDPDREIHMIDTGNAGARDDLAQSVPLILR